ncbi:flavin reductase family protein [Natronorarus salvus]|uniref:flavin reductase family protein n=1 Tax=Natronorarus salvus TaxID=3117733 RepID=UPI002F26562D
MELNPTEHNSRTIYRIMTTVTAPRPIAWISSMDSDGNDNLAPYSHYNNVCAAPPVVMFSAGTHRGLKDTTRNVLETEEFVINAVTTPLVEKMDSTSATLEPGDSEFGWANIAREESTAVSPPRVAESPVHLECILYDSMDVYNNRMILGEVIHIHIDDSLLTEGKVDSQKFDPVGRLGGPYYTETRIMDAQRQY